MKPKNISHSKVKNTGILFELLVRQITVDTMNEVQSSPALKIMKKYFTPSREMGKELQMYRSFFEMERLTESKAIQFIDLINRYRSKLDEGKLAKEKYNLVKEIKENYNLESFLGTKIPSYKVYASIYKTFLAESGDFPIQNISEVASSKFTLVEHLATDKTAREPKSEARVIHEFKNQSEDIRLLAHKLMIQKFNEKYSNLNSRQKKLLREYINNTPNSHSLINHIRSEVGPLAESIRGASKNESKVLQIKLNEVASQLENMEDIKRVKAKDMTALMTAYSILEEIENDKS
jgi:hypothetical protein